MDFSFDSELENIRHEARRLADQFDDDYWRAKDEKHEFPWDFYNAFATQGWIGIIVPEEYGGAFRLTVSVRLEYPAIPRGFD
jgi:acyl-CoA dehydrogenase